jgi:hypothetical protein
MQQLVIRLITVSLTSAYCRTGFPLRSKPASNAGIGAACGGSNADLPATF